MMIEAWNSVMAQTEQDIQVMVQYCKTAWPEKLNDAVNATRGDHIVILCDDDLLAPTYIEKCLRLMNQGADIAYTDRYLFEDGQPPTEGIHLHQHGDKVPGLDPVWTQLELAGFTFGATLPMTCMIRRTLWDRLDGHDPKMPHSDTEFWYRAVLANARTAYFPEPLFWYRQHAGQESKVHPQMLDAMRCFHRKHFWNTGVLMKDAVLREDGRMETEMVDEARRKELKDAGWTPDW